MVRVPVRRDRRFLRVAIRRQPRDLESLTGSIWTGRNHTRDAVARIANDLPDDADTPGS